MYNMRFIILIFLYSGFVSAQDLIYLKPTRVFDGEKMLDGFGVIIKSGKILAIASQHELDVQSERYSKIERLDNCTLLPGLIEGHTHLFLHPYNETPWDDQVLKESAAYRTARAVRHAENTLKAGFTTARDLGTEGAGFDDVGLKRAIDEGIISGPKLLIATKALVATGTYGPRNFASEINVPQGAEEADGVDDLIKKVRNQIGKGADLIKIYADYRWGLRGEAAPTFSLEEIQLIVQTARSAGRAVVAHASTVEGMRRAILGGVETIEHGDQVNGEILNLMKEKGVALCPTLAAGDAILQYRGWKKGEQEEPERIKQKRRSFQLAIQSGVKICFGGDVGVFAHGDNARELEMMAEYGMKNLDVLKAATAGNADIFHLEREVGRIKTGLMADILVVEGNPLENISAIRRVKQVYKDGKLIVSK